MSQWPVLFVIAFMALSCVVAAMTLNDRADRARHVCWEHSIQDHPRDAFASRDECLRELGYTR